MPSVKRNQQITKDKVMVTFDVVALFTSIPVEVALQVTRDRLQQDATLRQRTNISITNVMKLLDFVLKNSYFSYEQQHYQKTFGCATTCECTVANLVMEFVEEKAISTATVVVQIRGR